MSHSEIFDRLRRTMRLARDCDDLGLSTAEGLARRDAAEAAALSRRRFLASVGALAATGAAACAPVGEGESVQALTHGVSGLDVGIVGAGLAGLVCADQLRINGGVSATVYEANTRVGGRQFSLGGVFPGQVVERGGELIDTSQRNIINYARSFGLTLEDYVRAPGATTYHLNGALVPEATVVDSYRAFVAALRADVRATSNAPSANNHNAADAAVDNLSIAEYLHSRGADAVLSAAVAAAYVGEYGREITEQSALNLLLYIRADRRSKFQPFGTSDQRYHIVEGNDRVAAGLAARVAGQLRLGMPLVRVAKTAAGRVELTFQGAGATVVRTHDVVVLAVPFSVLRNVQLDASLGLPAWKTQVIQGLGYGSNAKNMVGFRGRPWAALGKNGMVYATLPNLQNCWETSWTTATATSAVMTNFTGGRLGASQDPARIQAQTAAFVGELDAAVPGAAAAATRDANGRYLASMMDWPNNPWSRGSYTCYLAGQFTSLAGNEPTAVGNLFFAGEHCDSFYDQQGFMEGAINSGTSVAAGVLSAARAAG